MMPDDPKFNIFFVKCIQKYPVLYNTTVSEYSSREEQEKTWLLVAEEVQESVVACKERWKNLRGCLSRDLRLRRRNGKKKKSYYLTKYMDFVIPFVKTRGDSVLDMEEDFFNFPMLVKRERDEDEPIEPSSENRICDDEQSDDIRVVNVNDASSSGMPPDQSWNETDDNISCKRTKYDSLGLHRVLLDEPSTRLKASLEDSVEDADLCFFKSLLPDLSKMTDRQKNKFKLGVLSCVNEILYEE